MSSHDLPRQLADLTPGRVRELLRVEDGTDVALHRIGAGFGLASVVVRVDLGFGDARTSYAVKICDADAARAEHEAYTDFLDRVDGLRVPVFIRSVTDGDAGVVVTEYVEGRQGDVLAGCDRATADALVGTVARLHAAWWGHPATDMPRPVEPLSSDLAEACIATHGDLLTPGGIAFIRRLTERFDDVDDRLSVAPRTLLHGDLHLDNVLHASDGPVLLDWAGARFGTAAVDVARCVVEFGADAGERELVDRYAAELERLGVPPPESLHADVDAAMLASAPGFVRWSVRSEVRPGRREWHLFRTGLRRMQTLLAD